MTIFAMFFITYLYSRGKNSVASARDQQYLNLALGTTNTVLLLSSSLVVALGVAAVLSGAHHRAPRLFSTALACGAGFVVVKALEWSHLLVDHKSPGSSEFYMYYFMFTGAHLGHVVIGCIALSLMIRATKATRLTDRTAMLCECGGIFWHMVDLLWVVLFALFYLVR